MAIAHSVYSDSASEGRALSEESKVSRPTYVGYVWALLLVVALAYLFKLRVDGIFACASDGYTDDGYLAYCNSTAYGDFDHGAFWFALGDNLYQRVAGADVLFIGSSRLQFGLSSEPTDAWFSGAGLSYYLLGFSHTETVQFTGPLLAKIRPAPKVWIINADRFFTDRVTPPASEIFGHADAIENYRAKERWQPVHRALCTAAPTLCGDNAAFFRDLPSGRWRFSGTLPISGVEVTRDDSVDPESIDSRARLARAFLAERAADAECVLLTLIPYPGAKRKEAEAVAQAAGLKFVSPWVDGLTTFDDSHLDRSSAAAWSRAFLDAAAMTIRSCTAPQESEGTT